ncbi:MAG: hypothetical protein HQ518_33065 [Rhodopirellula sp.]|nr:hypothetical protein [Rhodopirellula sp.]
MSQVTTSIRAGGLQAVFTAVVMATIVGCGSQAYEQRLAETAKYYAYRQQVDTALERNPWQEFGIQLRLPQGFQEIPGPTEEGEHDGRQPNFLSKPLPGLVAAWQSEVYVEIPDRESKTMPAWIFLCTNHQRFLDQQSNPTATPALFVEDLSNVLAAELRYEPDTALNRWTYEETRAPVGTPYVPRKTYEWIMLDDERNINDERVRMQFRLIRYYVNQIQFCLLTVAPHEEILDRRDWRKFYTGIDLAMENLVVSGDPPRQQSSGPPASGGGF